MTTTVNDTTAPTMIESAVASTLEWLNELAADYADATWDRHTRAGEDKIDELRADNEPLDIKIYAVHGRGPSNVDVTRVEVTVAAGGLNIWVIIPASVPNGHGVAKVVGSWAGSTAEVEIEHSVALSLWDIWSLEWDVYEVENPSE